ncbi:MAG: ABC transporter substrate-binding protein [Candidatus Dormibacteraeota bacterium]|nr:ABC transporter substrate-binding protein [Candidatus Dormibacteraeota bacterium]
MEVINNHGGRHMKTHGWVRQGAIAAATSVLAATLLAACSSGSSTTAPQGPINIGMVPDLTGPYSAIGLPDYKMAEMLVKLQNAKGGIGGRKINLIALDGQTSAATGLANVKQLVQTDHIVALLGPDFTSTAEVVIPYLDQHHIPTLADLGGGNWTSPAPPYVFTTPESQQAVDQDALGYMYLHGIKTLSWLDVQSGFGQTGLVEFQKLAPQFGVTILPVQYETTSATDVLPQLERMKQQHADAVMLYASAATAVVNQLGAAQIGFSVPVFQSNAAALPQFAQAAGSSANGVYMVGGNLQLAGSLPSSNPQAAAIHRFLGLYGSADRFAGDMYDATTLLFDAIKAVGPNSVKIDGWLNHDVKNYPGVTGVITYTPNNHAGILPGSLSMLRITNGGFELVQTGTSINQEVMSKCGSCLNGLPKP